MRIDILSLFPEYFESPLRVSILKRAIEKGLLDIRLTDIRSFAEGKHRKVDDRPYGGGPGMVLMPGPVAQAIRQVKTEESRVIYLSPQGRLLNAALCQELATCNHLILLCGHYEGIDQRVIDAEVDEEVSIGEYVLTSGCLPCLVLIDSVARFIPGVLGHAESAERDTFQNGQFVGPLYTRPEEFEGVSIPEVLKGGNHRSIEQWRLKKGLEKKSKFLAKKERNDETESSHSKN